MPWIDSLMRYVDLGGSCIVPGGAVAADDAFRSVNGNLTDVNGMLTEKQLAESKAWAEYITQAKLEKPGGYTIVCKYAPNPYLGAQAAIDAFPAWVERQITLGFGVELEEGADPILPHVMLAWPDPSVPGVAEVIAKMLGPLTEDAEEGKVKAVSLDLSGDVSCDPRPLRSASSVGARASRAASWSGIHALDKVGAQLVADATRSDVKVIAGDALLGGLVSERYLRVPAPTLAELKGTAAFAGLARVLASPGGRGRVPGDAGGAGGFGRGVATALVQAFADAGMKVEIETELEKGPAFEIGEPLGEEHTAAIVAAMSMLRMRAPEGMRGCAGGDDAFVSPLLRTLVAILFHVVRHLQGAVPVLVPVRRVRVVISQVRLDHREPLFAHVLDGASSMARFLTAPTIRHLPLGDATRLLITPGSVSACTSSYSRSDPNTKSNVELWSISFHPFSPARSRLAFSGHPRLLPSRVDARTPRSSPAFARG